MFFTSGTMRQHKMWFRTTSIQAPHIFFPSRCIITINTQGGVIFVLSATPNLHFHKDLYKALYYIYHPLIKLRIYCTTDALCEKSIKWWSREIFPKHLMVMGTTKRWHFQWRSWCPPQILKTTTTTKKTLEHDGVIFIDWLHKAIKHYGTEVGMSKE